MSDGDIVDGTRLARCDECGGIYIEGSQHSCEKYTGDGKNAKTREELSELDDGDPDDVVLVSPGGRLSAYHKNEDGEPKCGQRLKVNEGSFGRERSWTERSRGSVKESNIYYPCRKCHDLEE